ncbi:MAG: DegQ family serine endoprotease [Dokdonella sp.]
MPMSDPRLSRPLIFIPALFGFAIAVALACTIVLMPRTSQASLPAAVDGQAVPSLAPMLERVTPAVVNVNSKTRVRVRDPFFDDPVFRRFFGVPNQPRERVQQSLGSGVIVDANKGYVLTNNHVIEGADDVSVTLTDGRTVVAKVIGSDPDTDIAVLQIPAEHLSAIPLADISTLRVGDFVVAVGNPFGVGQTVTSGIVSALNRTGLGGRGYQNFIQTDASINPGNSGGPLVDLRGQLVGINSMIFSPSGGNVGIGFSIPVDIARQVMNQLIQFGTVKRGALGVETQDVTPELAAALKLGDARGAVVTRVRSGSAADQAGLKPGDTITTLNGKTVRGAQDLHNLEGLTPNGASVALAVLRDGQSMTIDAVLQAQTLATSKGDDLDPRLAGVQFGDIGDDQRREDIGGIAVTTVAQSSRAFANGLRSGDRVVAVNQRDIANVDDFRRLTRNHPRQLLLTVVRGQNAFYFLAE